MVIIDWNNNEIEDNFFVTCIVDNGSILPSHDEHFLAETAPDETHEFTSLIKDPGGEGGTRQEIAHLKDEPGSNVTFKTENWGLSVEKSDHGTILDCKVPMSRLQVGKYSISELPSGWKS